MGGTTFAIAHGDDQPALHCPRMSPHKYLQIRDGYTQILSALFAHVQTPIEAPEKEDHGDVDFIVSDPLIDCDGMSTKSAGSRIVAGARTDTDMHKLFDSLRHALRATRSQYAPPVFSYAVVQSSDTENNETEHTKESNVTLPASTEITYAQIDIKVCTSHSQFRWMHFKNSYGDLTNILGTGLRPLSMTLNEYGLVVRIPSIQSADLSSPVSSTRGRKTSCEMIVCQDPTEVMRFLGLDTDIYLDGFKTEEQAFSWLSSSHILDRATFLRFNAPNPQGDGNNATLVHTAKRRASKKRKMSRDIYRRFIEDYLPAHPDVFASTSEKFKSQESAVEQAIRFFGKQGEYEERMSIFQLAQTEARFWYKVYDKEPGDKRKANKTIRGLRRWVRFEDGAPIILEKPILDDDQHPDWIVASGMNEEALIHWIEEYGEHCMRLERERVKEEAELRKEERKLQAASKPPEST